MCMLIGNDESITLIALMDHGNPALAAWLSAPREKDG